MGLLTQVVNEVVSTVENATGNEDSDAGNWAEKQAAHVEDTADKASEAAAEVASDPVNFLNSLLQTTESGAAAFGQNIATHLQSGVGNWLFANMENLGIQIPSRVDIAGFVSFVGAVLGITADRVEHRVVRLVGSGIVGWAKQSAAQFGDVAGSGPAGIWGEIKEVIGGDVAGTASEVRRWAATLGVSLGTAPPHQAIDAVLRSASDTPASVWLGIKTVLHNGQGRTAESIDSVARRAENEILHLIASLRSAGSPAGSGTSPVYREFNRTWSRTIQGAELRRLTRTLLARSGGTSPLNREAARHVASSVNAAARAALLHAELLLWLTTVRRVARRVRVVSSQRSRPLPKASRAAV